MFQHITDKGLAFWRYIQMFEINMEMIIPPLKKSSKYEQVRHRGGHERLINKWKMFNFISHYDNPQKNHYSSSRLTKINMFQF